MLNLLLNYLTNRPLFSTVYNLIDHKNDVILKWNQESQVSGFTAKF